MDGKEIVTVTVSRRAVAQYGFETFVTPHPANNGTYLVTMVYAEGKKVEIVGKSPFNVEEMERCRDEGLQQMINNGWISC